MSIANHILMIGRKLTETQRSNRVPCDKVQIRIISMKQDTEQLITQPERSNFRKIIFDTYDCKCVIIAVFVETEDLIIEFCVTKETITNMCGEEGEEESTYGSFCKRHLRD